MMPGSLSSLSTSIRLRLDVIWTTTWQQCHQRLNMSQQKLKRIVIISSNVGKQLNYYLEITMAWNVHYSLLWTKKSAKTEMLRCFNGHFIAFYSLFVCWCFLWEQIPAKTCSDDTSVGHSCLIQSSFDPVTASEVLKTHRHLQNLSWLRWSCCLNLVLLHRLLCIFLIFHYSQIKILLYWHLTLFFSC